MTVLPNLSEIQKLIGGAQELLILTHENPNKDSLAASLALFLSLLAAGKKATVACPTAATVEFANLFGLDKIKQKLGGKNFIISLDYVEGSIDKVSYNISDNKFNLVIEPRSGAPTFSQEKVHYSQDNVNPDLIFLVDCSNLEQLGKFYSDEKDLYSKVPTINIDYHSNNTYFSKVNLVDAEASSSSEIITHFLKNLNLPLTEDMATNLLTGIDAATKNFTLPTVLAGAFEAAAICLKVGGKRGIVYESKQEIPQEAPADWLQPKIFKSGTTVQPVTSKDESTLL